MEEVNSDGSDEERLFYGTVREYTIFFLTFIILYVVSYCVINIFRQKRDVIALDVEDDWVYRISLWLCTFTLSVSIGAALLLPVSIVSNELLLMYQSSYYVKWLNSSLIHGFWNFVFLGSYLSLFVAIPFAYFFIESEGFAGSKKGIKARIYETFVVLGLLVIVVTSIVWVALGIVNSEYVFGPKKENSLWLPYLPFIYSCISCIGVFSLLIFTPVGLTRMFTVLEKYVVKPQFLSDIDEELYIIKMEKQIINKKLRKTLRKRGTDVIPNGLQNGESRSEVDREESYKQLDEMELERKKLERRRDASSWQRNLVYPLCFLVLLLLTAISMAMVALNFLSLLLMDEALPMRASEVVIGKVSSSMMGKFGAVLEIILIFYLMAASLMGFYSLPWFTKLTPIVKNTPMTQVIANCVVLLVLSSALPVLARMLGITTFDLMGEFGRFDWLGNLQLILLYNLWFEVASALCLMKKLTATVREALFERFKKPWKKLKSLV
ncbi:limb region 1 protein homolog isoform X2 [Dendronephthya gigantea]|uniref:limb region 1 protein homolog isoform X2 n=1 Tax=Dendronephthya gigantea TaxID=151771 RepID=UPI00106D22CC|nr:limb region 1 protein homolog isoform X2 [Dendronephthya gigantea]